MYFILDTAASPSSPKGINGSVRFPDATKSGTSQMDFESFKSDVQTTLGEPFFRKLKLVEQVSK